ncbi:hypothetical protein N566_11640 [Streptomycetaceae bacterium MP113-05]|nr:hypothetical protein N566_11640 [Streptomycetaceae bacterium MP113-05]
MHTGHTTRVSTYATVGTRLSLLSDRRLAGLVKAAPEVGTGIGGRSAALNVEGTPVFVKRVPLTDVELQPAHVRSTANLFGLPVYYQYGAGSVGFGAWRELAAHVMTTAWAVTDEYAGFPLLYHWRVLPDSPPTGFTDEFGGVDGAVAYWEGSDAVRRRLEAVGAASASLVLFLEHLPVTLAAELGEARPASGTGTETADHRVDPRIEEALLRGADFLRSRGMVHFDAHFANLLTHGREVYFSDFGLALSRDFELSAEEDAFLTDHLLYDRCYVADKLLRHHLPDSVRGGADHAAFLREWIAGRRHPGVPAAVGALIDRHAAHAVVLGEFHRRFLTESRDTPFPADEIRRAATSAATPRA